MNSKNLSKTQHLFGDLSLSKSSPVITSSEYLSSNSFAESPEIHDLIRFQNAIMAKYLHTQNPHFKNMANALTPQIEDKIREFHKNN